MKIFLIAFFLLLAAPAVAQVQYYSAGQKAPVEGQWQGQAPAPTEDQPAAADELAPAPQTRVVTSLEKCLDQLEPEEAALIRGSYNKPYQTCHAMLAAKAGKKKKAKKKLEEEPEAENARNYVRVQDGRTAGSTAAADTADESGAMDDGGDTPAPKHRKKKKGFFHWNPEIKADKSKANYNH